MRVPLNLIDGEFQNSNLFYHMPIFDEIFYDGHHEDKVRKYKAIREDQPCTMLALNIIRKEEKILWDAIEDFIKRSVSGAALGAHGVYVYDLLTIDIHKEANTFNHNELCTFLQNASRRLNPGEARLIKYSTSFGILQKFVHEDWGKITFKTSVDVFKDKPCFLDLLVKRLIKHFDYSNDPGILLLNDLSSEPLFDPQDDKQQERLQIAIEKGVSSAIEFPPEVYIQDRNGIRELLSGSNVG